MKNISPATHILKALFTVIITLILANSTACAQTSGNLLTPAQLEPIVAPIALYPDDLLAEILPASTLAIQVVEASRYLQQKANNPNLQPDSNWDQSIQALLKFPDIIKKMNDNLTWTQNLGNAVIAQQNDVMQAIQTYRQKVYSAGNLNTTSQQKVQVQDQIIQIQPADPQVIYVPQYDPQEVVVQQTNPAVPLLAFTAGVAIADWANPNYFDWYHNDIIVRPWNHYGPYDRAYARGYINGATNDHYVWRPTDQARANYNARYNSGNIQINNINYNHSIDHIDKNLNQANFDNFKAKDKDIFSGMSSGSSARDYSRRGEFSFGGRGRRR